MNLYEYSIHLDFIMDEVNKYAEEHDGEISDYLANQLENLQMDRDEKALNTARLIVNLKSEEKAIAEERKKLQAREKALKGKQEWLKNWLGSAIKKGEKLKDSCVQIGWRKSESVQIDDMDKLPWKYFKIERTPVKTMIKEDIAKLEGIAHIEERQTIHVR